MKQAVLHVVSPIKPFCVTINEKDTLHTIRDMLSERCSFLLQHSYSLTVNGLNMCDTALLHSMNPLEFPLNIQVRLLTLGGKGGFGANLKSQGGRNAWKKSDNFESCRDLSGRRIKTVNEAKLLADYIEAEPERRKLKEEQLRKKVEREQRRKNTSHKKMKAEEFGSDFEDEHEKALTGISSAVERGTRILI